MNFQSGIGVLLSVVLTSTLFVYSNGAFSTICHSGTNYTSSKNGPFQTNLGSAFTLLKTASSTSNYHNVSVGSTPDRALAIFMCRYDVPHSVCHDCVTTATSDLQLDCPTYWSASVQYRDCAVQYTNRTIAEGDEDFGMFCDNPEFGDPLLKQSVVETMSGLINNVTSTSGGGDDFYFATGEGSYMVYQKVYGLIQCPPQYSVSRCVNCLKLSMYELLKWCGGTTIGASAVGIGCLAKHNLYSFYNSSGGSTSLNPPPTPADTTPKVNSHPSLTPGALGTALGLAYILWRFSL